MSIAFYSAEDVLKYHDLRLLMQEMDDTFKNLDAKNFVIPSRNLIFQDNPRSLFISMPALSHQHGLFINKTATFFARESSSNLPSVHALVTIFSSTTGEPLALMEGTSLTKIKCAAVSAMVTHYCAAPNASKLAIIGAGAQAQQQFLGVCLVRDIKEIRIYNRSRDHLKRFADEIRAAKGDTIKVIEADSIDTAIDGADIIGTTTSSSTPIATFTNLAPHVHINCMGSHAVESREIPLKVLENSLLIVEDIPTAIAEAGRIHRKAIDLHQLTHTNVNSLQKTKTIFSSTGHALLDVIAVAHVLSLSHKNKT
jgi:ornithine cyclodeaminase/alanine dehydrogenase-like protein (mu-crystallin family)